MKYSNNYITINNKQVKQINKTTAKNLFNNGETIFFHPSNMRLNNFWQNPQGIKIDETEPLFKLSDGYKKIYQFDNVLNSFEYYNCCSERGKYANFFAQINN